MTQKTAMQQMLDELMAYEYTIPLDLIVKCKELVEVEKVQIENAYHMGCYRQKIYEELDLSAAEQYYNQKYGGK